uniref:Uncharacterized protein n=1 Tax=Thermosporothrix sp. COM3 TaxID=2490863 RepID=A0A455SHD8_9CHLR|nr:hypothetical protein KTC_19170 [Thermosporothrix sp. COM3]
MLLSVAYEVEVYNDTLIRSVFCPKVLPLKDALSGEVTVITLILCERSTVLKAEASAEPYAYEQLAFSSYELRYV